MGERQSVRVGIRGPAGRVSLAGDKPPRYIFFFRYRL